MSTDTITDFWDTAEAVHRGVKAWVAAMPAQGGEPVIVDHWYLGVLLGGHRDADAARAVVAGGSYAP